MIRYHPTPLSWQPEYSSFRVGQAPDRFPWSTYSLTFSSFRAAIVQTILFSVGAIVSAICSLRHGGTSSSGQTTVITDSVGNHYKKYCERVRNGQKRNVRAFLPEVRKYESSNRSTGLLGNPPLTAIRPWNLIYVVDSLMNEEKRYYSFHKGWMSCSLHAESLMCLCTPRSTGSCGGRW